MTHLLIAVSALKSGVSACSTRRGPRGESEEITRDSDLILVLGSVSRGCDVERKTSDLGISLQALTQKRRADCSPAHAEHMIVHR